MLVGASNALQKCNMGHLLTIRYTLVCHGTVVANQWLRGVQHVLVSLELPLMI